MAPNATQFSRLLQQSRFATFDPVVPQVYTAPAAYMARGEWGMKRPLPSAPSSSVNPHLGMLRYVEVAQLDTIDRQSDWKEREKETLFVKRWGEANTKLNIERSESGKLSRTERGSHGPQPTTSFLQASQRYCPSDIPGPIELGPEESATEPPKERESRLYNNKWRELMQYYAARGAADPSHKSLDYLGDKTRSPIFGFDADKFTTRPRTMVNYNALSEKEFDKYLERIRATRQSWKKHYEGLERNRLIETIRKRQEREHAASVEAREDARMRGATLPPLITHVEPEVQVDQIDMLEQSRDQHATREAFTLLEEKSLQKAASARDKSMPGLSQSSTIHPHAGLQYSQPDSIYTNVLSEPVPGRVIHEISSRNERDVRRYARTSDGRSVLAGGRVSYLHAPLRSQAPPTIDWSRQDTKQGTALFRVLDAHRTTQLSLGTGMHKDMLTPRNDLGYIRSNVEVVKTDAEGKPLNQQHPPGSAVYIGQPLKDPTRPVRRALGFGFNSNPNSKSNNPRNPATPYSFGGQRRRDNNKNNNNYSRPNRLGRDQSHPASSASDNPHDSATSTKQMLDNLEHLVNPNN